jgi:hypothetical protein
MKLKLIFKLLMFSVLTTSCLDDETNTTLVTNDYYLNWTYEKSNQFLMKSTDEGKSGSIVIPETVFAVGYNEDFIIAKQHPNKEKEISDRLFGEHDENGFILENPSDTIYLGKEDSIFAKGGKFYHISNGWNPPANLKPFKDETNYYIIDLKTKEKHSFKNRDEFEKKKMEIDVSKNLEFTIVEKELE